VYLGDGNTLTPMHYTVHVCMCVCICVCIYVWLVCCVSGRWQQIDAYTVYSVLHAYVHLMHTWFAVYLHTDAQALCVHVCLYVYVCICMYAYVICYVSGRRQHTDVYTLCGTYVCVCICVYTYMHAYMHTCIHTYIQPNSCEMEGGAVQR
jgi:hypothetical protein